VLQGDAFKKSVGNHSRFSICSALSLKAGESGARGTWEDPEENASGSATVDHGRDNHYWLPPVQTRTGAY
jgi:hypothetical protein